MEKKMLKAGFVAMAIAFGAGVATSASAQESAATRLSSAKIDKDQLLFNMESVGKLLESSSAARQIESSKAPEAMAKRERARELYKTAKTSLNNGELDKANAQLTEVRAAFFEAVRLAAPEEVTAKKLEADYKARLDSVNALLGAYRRVANEKGSSTKSVNETVAQIDKSVAEAARLAQGGRYKEGRTELDRAYLVAKAGISSLRSGDTLVRSLNFASKEEEYHYEIDRNDTHQMLIKVLVEEKRANNPTLDQQVQGFVVKAKELRAAAEAAAAKRDHAQAVKLLEDSTAELVKAIRNAGIYIPG
ncbi:MAG: putative tetratricopeptide [Proteobacteria bacterium]|nr:putative tetratricopeptide [Pseudomonadota bacterium]